MDGQNFQNEQNTANQQNNGGEEAQFSNNYYQDYTANIQPAPVEQSKEKKSSGLAIASLVLGIISIVMGCCGGGFPFSIGGIICGAIANKQEKDGMAKGGLICSIIGLVLSIAITIFIVVIYIMILGETMSYGYY